MTPEQRELGWAGDDDALHEGDTSINEVTDFVVDEAVENDDTPEDESGPAQGGVLWWSENKKLVTLDLHEILRN